MSTQTVRTFRRKEKPPSKAQSTDRPGPSTVKKEKKEKPIKIVLRRLPLNMTWEDLQIQLEPIPKYIYHRFCAADKRLRPHAFARVYFAFTCRQDAIDFCDRFNGYVFMDKEGYESTGVVELAPNDYIPETQRCDAKENDYKSGTLYNDPDYKNFATEYEKPQAKKKVDLESLLKGVDEKERQLKTGAIRETPLTDFIIQKTVDKIKRSNEKKRARDEKFGVRGKGKSRFEKKTPPQPPVEKKPGAHKQSDTETKGKPAPPKEKSRTEANPNGNRKERKAAAAAERRERERKLKEEKKEAAKKAQTERGAPEGKEAEKGANNKKVVPVASKAENDQPKPKRAPPVFEPAKRIKNVNSSSPAASGGGSSTGTSGTDARSSTSTSARASTTSTGSSSAHPSAGSSGSSTDPAAATPAQEGNKRERQPPARHVKNKDRPERALYQPGQRRRGGAAPPAQRVPRMPSHSPRFAPDRRRTAEGAQLTRNLHDAANRMRISSIETTIASKSGHPTSSTSAAEILATLFLHEMKYDISQPKHPAVDRFVLSNGHACPILYAAWEDAGHLTRDQVLSLRKIDSDIEGHPTPRLDFIDVATGSLGQGLRCAADMAYVGKYIEQASYRVYCLMGDGETAEGSILETATFSNYHKLDNLVAIVDVNRLGQSQQTALGHQLEVYKARFDAYGFHALIVDGNDVNALLAAYAQARTVKDKPVALLCKTLEGMLQAQKPVLDAPEVGFELGNIKMSSPPEYNLGVKVATRAAYGTALVKLGDACDRVVVDGDTKNSTSSEKLLKKHLGQFIECFIAEKNLVGVGIGPGCQGRTIPLRSTFAAFVTRAADQELRLGAGSHVGVSFGEDGPSQMALEDIAMFRTIPDSTVFYPADAVSTERATELAANIQGIVFIRTGRPALPVIYKNDEIFEIGKGKVVRQSAKDKVLIISAGATLDEALKAADTLKAERIDACVIDPFCIKPLDQALIVEHANRVGGRVLTVEDHYQAGGLGEAVAAALGDELFMRVRMLCVRSVPSSGQLFGISAKSIVDEVKNHFVTLV